MKKLSLFALLGMLMLTLGQAALADSGVARAIITSAVVDREPVDELERVPGSHERVHFFTELRGMSDQNVTHRWLYDNEVNAEIDFNIGGPRWRVWSSKTIMGHQQGEWRVEVIDGVGNVIAHQSFHYGDDNQ